MVSIREIMRMWKGKRGVTQNAATEFKERAEALTKALVNLSNWQAQKRGGNNARLTDNDVQLAYLTMIDVRTEKLAENVSVDEDFGDWNAE